MSRPGHRCATPAVVLVVLVALAGCAGVPTSGPVKAGGDLRLQRADEGAPAIGQPPQPGAAPADIVRGFLQSSADFQNDHEVARLYLTPAARRSWRPQDGTLIYDKVASSLVSAPGDAARVTFEAAAVGAIAADGGYSRPAPSTTVSRPFRLERVDGQWRISELGNGLLLSSVEVADTYRPVSLYFLAPSGGTLVPDPIFLPELPGLSTKLVARLLRGPTSSLRSAVTTAFPEGTELDVSSVPVIDGVATVRLDPVALKADDTARQQMSAQLVWTLKQLATVTAVRITVGGETLQVSGAGALQSRGDWATFDPDRLPSAPSVYLALDGRVGRYLNRNAKFGPVLGAGGAATPQVRTPAVSLDNQRLASVSVDGTRVLVGRMTEGAVLEVRITGTDFSAPSWDRDNGLWVVDRSSGALLYLPDGANKVQTVDVPTVSGQRVESVRMSRDGARAALVVGSGRSGRLVIGAVHRVETANPDVAGGELLSLEAVSEPLPGLRGVRAVAWADATHVEVLGSLDEATLRPYQVSVDGATVSDIEPLAGDAPAVSIAAAPPESEVPVVVGSADGEIWTFTSSRGWEQLGPGTAPAYPG